MKRFWQYVYDARKAKGWTLARLAWEIRSHKGYVSGIENDKVSPPSPRIIAKLSRKLDLPVDEMQAVAFLEKRPEAVTLDALYVAVVSAAQDRAKVTSEAGNVTGITKAS